MAEAIVKEKVCNTCGVEIRPNTLFCYSCGGDLSNNLESNKDSQNDEIEIKAESAINKPSVKTSKIKTQRSKKKNLKTAASLRKKPKKLGKKQVEIIWEEPSGNLNIWFVLGTLLLTVLGIALFFLAMYLK